MTIAAQPQVKFRLGSSGSILAYFVEYLLRIARAASSLIMELGLGLAAVVVVGVVEPDVLDARVRATEGESAALEESEGLEGLWKRGRPGGGAAPVRAASLTA
jgi:hypothetical protein